MGAVSTFLLITFFLRTAAPRTLEYQFNNDGTYVSHSFFLTEVTEVTSVEGLQSRKLGQSPLPSQLQFCSWNHSWQPVLDIFLTPLLSSRHLQCGTRHLEFGLTREQEPASPLLRPQGSASPHMGVWHRPRA